MVTIGGTIERTMENLVSVSELRQNAARILKRVGANGQPCVVISRSKPVAVILGARAYEAMRRQILDLERAELVRAVKASEAEHRAGKTKVLRSLRDLD
jgi:prevent-host-death family protein